MGTTCANSNTIVRSGSAATRTISPGRYCKGINFTGSGKTLIMQAGTYYVESIFMVGNGANLNATAGVTIVIVGNYCLGDTNNTCAHPDEGIGNSTTWNITAPTTGTYAGVAMYFSSPTYRMHNWANNANLNVTGTFYAPKQKLSFNNNSNFNSTLCTKIIALRLTINNNGNVSASCGGTGVKTDRRRDHGDTGCDNDDSIVFGGVGAMIGLIRNAIAAIRGNIDGVAALEFAFIAPALTTMTLAAVDVSMLANAKLAVDGAARNGANYAVAHGYNSTTIANKVTGATRPGFLSAITAYPAPTQWYGCPAGTSVTTAASSTVVCANGNTAGTYVTANAQATYTYILPWPTFGTSQVVSASFTVRIA